MRELVNVTQDVSLLDPFDFPVAIPEIARNQLVPERWMADERKQKQKAAGRAEAARQQQEIESAPAAAAMIKARAVAAKSGALESQQGAF